MMILGVQPEFRKLPCSCQVIWWTFIITAIMAIGAVWGHQEGGTEIDGWAGAIALPILIGFYFGIHWLLTVVFRGIATFGRKLVQTIRRQRSMDMMKQITLFTLLLLLLIGCGELGFGVENAEPDVVTVVVVATPTLDSAETATPNQPDPTAQPATELPNPTATNSVAESSELPNNTDAPSDAFTLDCEPRSGDDFSGQTQSRPNYRATNLRCANFDSATLAQPDFDDSDLSGATFVNARLSQSDCDGSNMIGVDFSGALIAQGDFADCDLTGAELRTATLSNVDWDNTICPNGVNSDAQANTCASESAMSPLSIFVNGAVLFSETLVGVVTDIDVDVAVSAETAVPTPALSPEWYIDSDGNAIPDFIEINLGFNPLSDDCAPDSCQLRDTPLVNEQPASYADDNVLVILDASGSMADALGPVSRMEAAKQTLTDYVAVLPPATNLGLLVYGHEGDGTDAGKPASCAGVELLADVGTISVESFPSLLDQFQPNGWTPIAAALQSAETTFAKVAPGNNKIILVTDGLETCDGDPIAVATLLHNNPNINLIIDVVGFGIASAEERNSLEQLAAAGGGVYVDVQRYDEFQDFVRQNVEYGWNRLRYSNCVALESLSYGTCTAQLLLGAATTISTEILRLGTDITNDHSAAIAELQLIEQAINAAQDARQAQFDLWITRNQQALADYDSVQAEIDARFDSTASPSTTAPDQSNSQQQSAATPTNTPTQAAPLATATTVPPPTAIPATPVPESNNACAPGTGANYAGELLAVTNFANQDLRNANFTGATLTCADFSGATLGSSTFNNVNAAGINFAGADIGGAAFNGAYLENANFTGAALGNNAFNNANLRGANFSGAIWGILKFDNTICPDGTNSNDNGGSCALR